MNATPEFKVKTLVFSVAAQAIDWNKGKLLIKNSIIACVVEKKKRKSIRHTNEINHDLRNILFINIFLSKC